MNSTGINVFDTSIQKTNVFIKEVEEELGWEGKHHEAHAAVRAVLHALRDRLTVEQSAHLSAQLYLLLRGLYFEDWQPTKVPQKMHWEEFIDRVRQQFIFSVEDNDIERVIRTVLRVLGKHIAPGEMKKIKATLPKDLLVLFE